MEQEFTYTDYRTYLDYLKSFSEGSLVEFQHRLIPEEQILGVRTPHLRSIAKQIAKGDWRKFLAAARDDTMEEIMMQGLVIGYAKMDYEEALERAASFAPKINSWATCDICCSSFRFFKKNRESSLEFLKPYLQREDEFLVRFGVILLMDFFICDEYIDRLFPLFDSIKHEGYYVKMGIAWAVSVCFVKFPQNTAVYLNSNKLDDWTYNKALQKIIESRRVDDEAKKKIRTMKRKTKKQ